MVSEILVNTGFFNGLLTYGTKPLPIPMLANINKILWHSFPGNIYQNHYGDVIMGVIASQITSLTSVYSTVYWDADQRKHQSSASLAFFVGNSPGTGEFPAQMVSNTENVSIWWRHHVSIPKLGLKVTHLKLQPHLPRDKEIKWNPGHLTFGYTVPSTTTITCPHVECTLTLNVRGQSYPGLTMSILSPHTL